MAVKRTGEIIELLIHGMSATGAAVGRHKSGLTVFVTYALPGETVRAQIREDKGRYAFADVVERLTTAPFRITPPCRHFGQGRCGGCDWQHIDYPQQLVFKRQIVAEQLQRIGKLPDVPVEDVHASPDPFNYRAHVTMLHDRDRLGFVSTDDRSPYWIDTCPIVSPALQDLMADREARQRLPRDKRIRLITDGQRIGAHSQAADFDTPPRRAESDQVVYPQVRGVPFRVSPGSFFQANIQQAEALVQYALDMLNLTINDDVVDVYCGVGLFTVFAAHTARSVVGIEQSRSAVLDARHNTRGLPQVEIVEGDAGRMLRQREHTPSVVIVDPPRSGLASPALHAIAAQRPDRWLYVSCDPTTFARDARLIVDTGYQLRRVKPVDMFPQTHHIELVSLFTRTDA